LKSYILPTHQTFTTSTNTNQMVR